MNQIRDYTGDFPEWTNEKKGVRYSVTTMRYPLTLHGLLERAHTLFPDKEIVSRTGEGIFRYTYQDYYQRVHRLAAALEQLGVQRGDRVGTIAWNHHRHLEAYFAIPCMGAVLHTINLRLPPDHLVHIINHAADKVLLIDEDLLPLVEQVRDRLTTVEHFVVMTDSEALPATSLSPLLSYEALLAKSPNGYQFPTDIDEWAPAGMCFSSATTGNPKGVTYTHRAIYLHSMVAAMADTIAVSEKDAVLPVVPMFHVNAWGLPFVSVWMGAKQVFPGPRPDPRNIAELIQTEKVTLAAGVPTVWLGVLQELEQGRYDFSSVTRIVCGGSAAPQALVEAYEKKHGIPFLHAYGMTEAAPVTHVGVVKSRLQTDDLYAVKAKQGLLVPGLEMRVVKENGEEVAHDGQEMGELWLRGPWIADEYYNDPRTEATFGDGWYHTGDVATVDPDGYMQIVDRVKDLVKSGGEWISTVDLENAIMAHPKVAEAAVVAAAHPRWDERPLACVVPRPEYRESITAQEILDHLQERFPKWWLPDEVVFIDQVPKTSVGKFDKKVLRQQYRNYLMEQAKDENGE